MEESGKQRQSPDAAPPAQAPPVAAAPSFDSLVRGPLPGPGATGASTAQLLALQRSAGNAAVARLLGAVAPPGPGPSPRGRAVLRAPQDEGVGAPRTGPAALIVDGETSAVDGRIGRLEFLDRVEAAVHAVAERELAGSVYSVAGCPWIDHWIGHYRERTAAEVASSVERYAPAARAATVVEEIVAAVANRVEAGIRTWRETGALPPQAPDAGSSPAAGPPAPEPAPAGTVARAPAADPAAVQLALGEGDALPGHVRSRMAPLLGSPLTDVRLHTGVEAGKLTRRLNARAIAVGRHVAFAPGQYEPGTLAGDAMLAHELAHTVQQGDEQATVAASPALEADADTAAAGAVAELWGGAAPGRAAALRRQAGPALRSGLSLQRCGDSSGPRDVTAAAPTTAPRGSTPDDMPGQRPSVTQDASTAEVRLDGDGDQHKELATSLRVTDPWPDGAVRGLRVDVRQLSSGTTQGKDLQLPQTGQGGGRLGVTVHDVADGRHPARIGMVTPPGERELLIQPPVRTERDVSYGIEVAAGSTSTREFTATFPPERTPIRSVFSTEDPSQTDATGPAMGGARRVGNIWALDLTIGGYGDRFRLTFTKSSPEATTAVFGLSVLSGGEPVAGERTDIRVPARELSPRMLSGDGTRLALDLDGDNREDLLLFDRLTEAQSGGSLERNRDHTIFAEGPSMTAPRAFAFPVRDGRIRAGRTQPDMANEQAASQARAVTGLERQGTMADADDEIASIDRVLTALRHQARQDNLISQELYDAWEVLARDFIVDGPAMRARTVPEQRRREIAAHASALHRRLAHESAAGERWEGTAGIDGPGESGHNPFTGGTVIRGGGMRIHEAPVVLISTITDGDWPSAIAGYRSLVAGMDRWIARRSREVHGSYQDRSRPETMRAGAIEQLSALRGNLEALEGTGRRRVSAVLHPTEEYERTGEVSEIPLSMYYWSDDHHWFLEDRSRAGERHEWSVDKQAGQTEPPAALFRKVDENAWFPAGILHYTIPGRSGGGQVRTTGPSTLRQLLTYGALVAGVVGAGMLAGPAGVQVAGAYILAGSAIVGAGMAAYDLVDRGLHGNLTGESVILNLADIVGAVAGLGALRAGRILAGVRTAAGAQRASQMTSAIRWADRWFIPLHRTGAAAGVVTLAVVEARLERDFESIKQMPDGEAKSRALRSFFIHAAMTGAMGALSIRGAIPELQPGRNVRVEVVGGIEYALPEGVSVQGQRINQAREAAAAAGADDAARQAVIRQISAGLPGEGGVALRQAEALASGLETAAVNGAGRVVRGAQVGEPLEDLVTRITRANSEAGAHGVDVQYVLRMEPAGADGLSAIRVTSARRGAMTAADVLQQHLAATTGRSQVTASTVASLRAADPHSTVDLLPNSELSLNGQIEISPTRLNEMIATDPTVGQRVLVATRVLAGHGTYADLQAAAAAQPPTPASQAARSAVAELDGLARSGSFRLRFRFHATLGQGLSASGFPNLSADAQTRLNALVAGSSEGDRIRMWDLVNESVRGDDPSWRTLYAEYAMSRNPGGVREFVNRYQFARADIDRRFARLEAIVTERVRTAQAARRMVPRTGRRGGMRAYDHQDARAELLEQEAQRAQITPVPDSIEALIRAEYSTPAGRERLAAIENGAIQAVRGQTGGVMLAPGTAPVDPPGEAVARLREAGRIPFGEETTAAYHVHKHHHELPDGEQFRPGSAPAGVTSEHEAVLESARLTIASGDAGSVRVETTQDGSGRRFFFSRAAEISVPSTTPGGAPTSQPITLRALVLVTADGSARLLTYGAVPTPRPRPAGGGGARGGGTR